MKTMKAARILSLMTLLTVCCVFTDTDRVCAETKYLPITYSHERYTTTNNSSVDYWWTIIPPKYKMHYSYAEDKIFGRERHTSSSARKGATLAVNSQFLGFPVINGKQLTEGQSVAGYDFFISQNPNPTGAFDVFNVGVTQDPTDERVGMSFKDINLGFDYEGNWVSYPGTLPWVTNNEIYMALFSQIIKNGEMRTTGTPYLNAKHPRTWLAYDEKGNQFVATCAGRNAPLLDGTRRTQNGLTYIDMVEVTRRHMPNIVTMYNLDGGGSCSFVYKGEKLSPHYDNNNTTERRNYGTFYWKVEKRKVTAHHYVRGTTTTIADDAVQILDEGDTYNTTPVNVSHYKLASTPGNATGTLSGNTDVNYFYDVNHSLTHIAKTAATCETSGNIEHWKCSICGELFKDSRGENPTTATQVIVPKKGHSWNSATYTWNADNTQVTAKRVCGNDAGHKEEETDRDVDATISKAPTCEEKGQTTYTASFSNTAFKTQSRTLDNIDPLGHKWDEPTYTWNADNTQVTAKRICGNDTGHKEEETDRDIDATISKAPTCEEKGQTTYTASFSNTAFKTQSRTLEDIDPLGHKWDEPTYTWNADNTQVTAKRICGNDADHKEEETDRDVDATITKAPTCEEKGQTTYTASFSNTAFKTQSRTLDDIDPLGHKWDNPTYTWNDDNTQVTAKRICGNDAGHKEEETDRDIDATISKAPTCEEKGQTTYTASFSNTAFKTQSRTLEDIAPLGHNWDNPTYTWNADNTQVTAKRICGNDAGHKEEETDRDIDATISKTPTCEEKGQTTYTASFSNTAFETQSRTLEDIDPTGHNWDAPTYTWSNDNRSVTAQRNCTSCSTTQTEEVATTAVVLKEPTQTEAGKTIYTSNPFKTEGFTVQTKTVTIMPPIPIPTCDPPWIPPELFTKVIVPGSGSFSPLRLKSTSQTKTSATLTWVNIKGAKEYVIFGNRCGEKNKAKRIVALNSGKKSIQTRKVSGLKKATYHKFIVVALDKQGSVISISDMIHVATKGGVACNHKSISVKAKIDSKGKATKKYKNLTSTRLKKGKSLKLKVILTPASKKLRVSKHTGTRFESSNPGIATVSGKGVIKSVKRGKCYIYAYAQNGIMKRIKINVK